MKSFIRVAKFTLCLLAFSISGTAFSAQSVLQGKYKVDPAHTRVSFVVPHFVVSEVEGRFNDVTGEFTLAEPFTKSKVSASIPVASIDTGVKQRDDHLRTKDFFDATKYPTMKLVSKSISGTPDAFKVVVALTIKDVTKDVTFDGKYTGSVKDTWGAERAALQLTGSLSRKDFHINYDDQISIGAAVGDEIKIHIRTEGIRIDEKKKAGK